MIPPSPEKEQSVVSQSPSKMQSPGRALSHVEGSKVESQISVDKQPSASGSKASPTSHISQKERERIPTRPLSPDVLDAEETRIVNDALAARTPRTSYYGGSLQPDDTEHYHDMELCVLLHQETDPTQHDIVKKALRKAIRQRIKKLGMKFDQEVSSFFGILLTSHLDYFLSQSSSIKRIFTIMTQTISLIRMKNLRDGPPILSVSWSSCSSASKVLDRGSII